MKTPARIFALALFTLVSLAFPAKGAAPSAEWIPEPLKTWQGWVLWDSQKETAPSPYSDGHKTVAFWPGRLTLQVNNAAGRFNLGVRVYSESWVPLPGSNEVWPLEVKANGAAIPVVLHEDHPSVHLAAGTYQLEGGYRWNEIPQSLKVPSEIGVLALMLNGQSVEAPTWDASGALWLKREGSTEETAKDFLAVKVYGEIEDGIPQWLNLEVELVVSGKSREEDIGSILPEGWKLAEVNSPLPVAIDETGRMKAQVRAGKWTVTASAFRLESAKEFKYATDAKPAVEEELIAFQAKPDFRLVEITGAPSIDVSQTTFPDKWRDLPVYRWDTATPFQLEERMRGMGLQKPEGLKINRTLWLDEDGRGLTFRDSISGTMQQIWRLDAAEGQNLGSVRSNGEGQLITRNPQNGAAGVEIRTRNLNLEATGRMDRARKFSASGWQADADGLNVQLNLPPGWRLFALFGADWVQGDWLTAWSLLDLFLLLIFTLAVFRLWGFVAAVLAFAAFALSYHEPGAPRYVWLILLIPLGLLRAVPAGWGRRLLLVCKWLAVAILILTLVPFVAQQVQQAIYPQLENSRTLGYANTLGFTTFSANQDSAAAPVANEAVMNENSDVLVTKEYKVPPDFFSAQNGSTPSAKALLESDGVTFPPGANATYLENRSTLIVRNTRSNLDLIDNLTEIAGAVAPANASAPMAKSFRSSALNSSWSSQNQNLQYDSKARIQTGPGVPDWSWRTVAFGWRGPVQASQEVHPVLISLTLERLLTILRVALLLALAAVLLNARRFRSAAFRAPGVTTAAIMLVMLGCTSVQAQMPDNALLTTLKDRLLQKSDAFPNAADIPSVTLTLNDRKLSMDVEVQTATLCAVPLPGRLPAWSPVTVLVDGKAEAVLRRDDGYLWVVLPEGVHRVHVEGLLSAATEWEWTFLLKPHLVTINAPGWNVSGVRPNGAPEQQVFFALKQKATAGEASYDRQDYQSVVTVDRNLELGLIWQVHTTVSRLSPEGKAIALRIPLLPGENIISSSAIVKDGFIEVRLGAKQSEFSWDSEISPTDHLKLSTEASDSWVERWQLVASPVWNVGITGLTPIFESGNPELVPVWHPWPGESVELAISRPEAIAGATVTVNRATQEISLGQRQRTAQLTLALRCSLGQDFLIDLPADAEITALTRDSQAIPVRKDGSKLIIPVSPGEQALVVGWTVNEPLGWHAKAAAVRLPVESANINTTINVPDNRWVLWTEGPLRGPAVRFWAVLACSLIAAWILGRLALSPLRPLEWMLLAIGLTQVPLPAALVVIGWLFLFAWRSRESFLALPTWCYNVLQVGLILLTIAALCIFVGVVGAGLLGSPEMFIEGNGSTSNSLQWYQARSGTDLPQPGCFSVSIWWYRLLMLGWALWLAAALIRWLRWTWQQFCTGGAFHKGKVIPPPIPKQD